MLHGGIVPILPGQSRTQARKGQPIQGHRAQIGPPDIQPFTFLLLGVGPVHRPLHPAAFMRGEQPFDVCSVELDVLERIDALLYVRIHRSPLCQEPLPLLVNLWLGAPRHPQRGPVCRPPLVVVVARRALRLLAHRMLPCLLPDCLVAQYTRVGKYATWRDCGKWLTLAPVRG